MIFAPDFTNSIFSLLPILASFDTRTRHRVSLSIYFFLSGFCFSSWTSRIPTIKSVFNLNDAQLGNLLMVLPASSLIGLPLSGWLVSRYESRIPLGISFGFYCIAMAGIGFSGSMTMLIISIFGFAFTMRIFNIAINTQSIILQKQFEKKINGAFHALWSSGGLIGIVFTTFMIKLNIKIEWHLAMVAVFTLISAILFFPYLLKNDKVSTGNKIIIGKPDTFILSLGLIVFLSSLCEGGIFDWSGVYFREVVRQDVFTLGYLIFMAFMALSRFYSDQLIDRIGMKKTYLLSAMCIMLGISIVIVLPYFWPVLIGFSITGVGVASIIPMTYSLTGRSKKYSPGVAISLIATYSIVGMLIGPSIIGYVSHWLGLKFSFVLFILSGALMIPISQQVFRILDHEQHTKS